MLINEYLTENDYDFTCTTNFDIIDYDSNHNVFITEKTVIAAADKNLLIEHDINLIELRYLTSDHTFHSPRVNYYRDIDQDMLVIIADDAPYYPSGRDWVEDLCLALGRQHPIRVLETLKEQQTELYETEIDDHHNFLLNVTENDQVELYRKIKDFRWEDHRTWNRVWWLCQNVEDPKEIAVEVVDTSRYQGSPDYEFSEAESDFAQLKIFGSWTVTAEGDILLKNEDKTVLIEVTDEMGAIEIVTAVEDAEKTEAARLRKQASRENTQ